MNSIGLLHCNKVIAWNLIPRSSGFGDRTKNMPVLFLNFVMERKETVKANFSSKCLNSFYCVSVFIFLERYLGHFTIGKDRETSNWAIIAFLFCTIVFFFLIYCSIVDLQCCVIISFFFKLTSLVSCLWLRYFPSNLFFTAWFFYSHLHNISNPVLIRGHGNKQTMYILVSPFLFSDNKFLSLPCHQLRQKGETG